MTHDNSATEDQEIVTISLKKLDGLAFMVAARNYLQICCQDNDCELKSADEIRAALFADYSNSDNCDGEDEDADSGITCHLLRASRVIGFTICAWANFMDKSKEEVLGGIKGLHAEIMVAAIQSKQTADNITEKQ